MGTLAVQKDLAHNYLIKETYQAGIKLLGWEVKSLKMSNCKIKDAVVIPNKKGLALVNLYIAPYNKARAASMQPSRSRDLLLTSKEMAKIKTLLGQNKSQLLALKSLYTKGGLIKAELALVEKKRKFDKRKAIKEKEIKQRVRRFVR